MNWVKYEKNNCAMPELELNSPATDTVWVRVDNPYANKYGVGFYDYESGSWSYFGCPKGFNVTHWAAIVPPEGERY